MKVLKVLGSIFLDGLKFLGEMILGLFLAVYIFSGFGFLILIACADEIGQGSQSAWIGVVLIVLSWLGFLWIEVDRRMKLNKV